MGERIDEVFMQQAPSMAVRNRRGVLRSCIQAAVEQAGARGERARIMSLACGPARELMDVFDQTPRARWPVATLLDIDAEALKLVGQSLAQRDASADGTLVQANLIRLALGREKLELPPQQLIYSIGLIDYFNDEFVIRLLDWVHERLAPGGEVVLGNFHPRNPVKATMDHILEWKLIHRSEDDMQRLFAASRFGGCSRMIFEDAQVNLFAVGQRAA